MSEIQIYLETLKLFGIEAKFETRNKSRQVILKGCQVKGLYGVTVTNYGDFL